MIRTVLICLSLFLITACGEPKFIAYDGPEITQILVDKSERKMYLLHGNKAMRVYDVGLGFNPEGHKAQEGDGRTPEGAYRIDRRNPNSAFYLSIGMSYPNRADVAKARTAGVKPGGDIFIHGGPRNKIENARGQDWTAGCIAVKNHEMREIYAMVKNGTPIFVKP